MAVKTAAQIKADADEKLPSNQRRLISPMDVRERFKDIVDSIPSIALGGADFTNAIAGLKNAPGGIAAFEAGLVRLDNFATANVLVDQRDALNTAFQLAETLGMPIKPSEGFYYVKTAGASSAIKLKRCPTIDGVLSVKWVLETGTNQNVLFQINGLFDDDGNVRTASSEEQAAGTAGIITGSPTLNKHGRSLTIAGLSLSPGDWIAVLAGEDPADSNERHWNVVTRVESYDSVTGALKFSDGAPYSINYGSSRTDIRIFKLSHNPFGGSFSMSVDYSSMGTINPSHPCIMRFCRGFHIPSWEEFETDFGLATGPGADDWTIGTYRASQTATQAQRDPTHPYGPFNAKGGTIHRMHLSANVEADTAIAIHDETHSWGRVDYFELDLELGSAPTHAIFNIAGGSRREIGTALIRSNQSVLFHTFNNTTGEEEFRCEDLLMDGAGVIFNPATVFGKIKKLDDKFEFGPLFERVYELTSDDGSDIIFPLGNMVVAGIALKSSNLTSMIAGSGINITAIRDVSNTRRVALALTSNDAWVRTTLTTPNVYWSSGGAVTRINRMDLTDKEIFVDCDGNPTTIYAKVRGRMVDGDYF